MEGVCPKTNTKGPELFPRMISVVSSCVQSSGVNVPAPPGSLPRPESPVLSLASAWPQERTDRQSCFSDALDRQGWALSDSPSYRVFPLFIKPLCFVGQW